MEEVPDELEKETEEAPEAAPPLVREKTVKRGRPKKVKIEEPQETPPEPIAEPPKKKIEKEKTENEKQQTCEKRKTVGSSEKPAAKNRQYAGIR